MKTKNSPFALCLLFFIFAPLSPAQGQSQAAHSAAIQSALAHTVHLDLTGVAVKQALAELTAQCKIQIAAEDYLEDRLLSLHLVKMSLEEALDTITEGNGWVWYEQNDKAILLTRPHILVPHDLSEVPAAFKAALPKDMSRFMGYGASPLDLMPEDFMQKYASRSKENPHSKEMLERTAQNRLVENMGSRLRIDRLKQQKPFEQMLVGESRTDIKIPYEQLTADQKTVARQCNGMYDTARSLYTGRRVPISAGRLSAQKCSVPN